MSTYVDITRIVTDRDTYRLVRERSFTSTHDDLIEVLRNLRTEKASGTLTIDLSQGGINRVRFREEQDIHHEK